ncbi:undecaprenyldiphospho-muramoylpentapeptide beta-N-acetylglucosaminyltransferase [Geitlerinema sp. PCC 9228]|jgi:UDP-N-acetylglucosamine--N-acetylmuramyl-(pentapeptide) pyrophosphoryl-undecaprenol N-acetylglucosamine transferase|uniref:undecaprenyldiphospho-muramoylpentapeptide beta-N-acetylglucosaminyltransferase n=1 Tax=Geitlerinema sp. PCC 9228 TaxID=111611 RepID=UPI000A034057|nr:undecaprenyldiphospho-muramoylpentapeptide beta-N-acetylglucosaminyltransferase [Geitlerinema sp. PCC 9228]
MKQTTRLLIAASGTGGHLFPALAVAKQLHNYHIEWLGVRDRLETKLVGPHYPLHTINVSGLQRGSKLAAVGTLARLIAAIATCRQLLQKGNFQGVFTTGGYIAAPSILAARSLGLPAILHESNALPGKVTRWLSPWCSVVGLGFGTAAQYLPRAKTVLVGTPVRPEFTVSQPLQLDLPAGVPLIVVMGGSQGAVAVNELVRQCAPAWFQAGAWVVHLTGSNDTNADSLQHPQYISMPFYDDMAALLQRADLAISRAGAGTLAELALAATPSVLIPYPYAAEDHQAYNAAVFAGVGAAIVLRQGELTTETLQDKVLQLLQVPEQLQTMADNVTKLSVADGGEQMAGLIRETLEKP